MRWLALSMFGLGMAIGACSSELVVDVDGDDPTAFLTGTEETPLLIRVGSAQAAGAALFQVSCPAGKALVCHRPPGNLPAEHTLCAGDEAVSAHLGQHPDLRGLCGGPDGGSVNVPLCTGFQGPCGSGQPPCCTGYRCSPALTCEPLGP